MSLHRRNPKRDGCERPIFDALEAQGFAVMPISGRGIPDAVVAQRNTGRLWLVEIKQPGKGFTPAQVAWRQRWAGPAPITLRTIEDARRFALLAMETPMLTPHERRALAIGLRSLEREQEIADAMGDEDEWYPGPGEGA